MAADNTNIPTNANDKTRCHLLGHFILIGPFADFGTIAFSPAALPEKEGRTTKRKKKERGR